MDKRNWTPEDDALLGKMFDEQAAKIIGCSTASVTNRRNKLNIQSYLSKLREKKRKELGPKIDPLLETMPDKDIAEEVGCAYSYVKKYRKSLNIPAYKTNEIPQEVVELLGKVSDNELSKKYGYTRDALHKERLARNIPPFLYKSPPHKWTEEEIEMIGTTPDEIIAEKIGITEGMVSRKRRELGISKLGTPRRHHFAWEEWEIEICHENISAEEVAKKIGRTTKSVISRRRTLGLHCNTGKKIRKRSGRKRSNR